MTKPKLRFKDKNGNAYPEWEENLLGDIGELRNGIAKGCEFFGHGHKFINLQDVFGKDCLYDNDYDLVETSEKERQLNDLKKGDVIFVRSSVKPSGVGLPSVVMEDLKDTVFSGFLIRFREHKLCLNLLYKRYCFIVDSFRREVLKRSSSSANTNINQDNLANIKLKIPCLEEQEKIAGFLSKVDELINECEGEVKDLEEQKKGLMQKIFSQQIRFKDSNNNPYPDWEEKYVNEVCDISTGKGNTQDKEDNGIYPFYVRSAIIERSNKYIFDGEAVLTVGDGVGTGKVYHYVNGKFNFHQRVYKMSNFNGILGKYFYYYFSTHFYDRVKKMTAKTSVDSVRLEMISKMTLLIPCQEEQEKIAKVLSKMDELIEEKKALLSDWQQLKKGLLQQMFV